MNDTPQGSVIITGTLSGSDIVCRHAWSEGSDGIGTFSYQWQRTEDDIVGRYGRTRRKVITLTSSEVGKQIRVLVSYTDTYGTTETVVSEVSSAVTNVNDAPTGSILLEGSFVEDEVLTVITGNLEDNDGLGALNYQWQRSGDGDDWNMIIGADEDRYTLDDDDVGQQFVQLSLILMARALMRCCLIGE